MDVQNIDFLKENPKSLSSCKPSHPGLGTGMPGAHKFRHGSSRWSNSYSTQLSCTLLICEGPQHETPRRNPINIYIYIYIYFFFVLPQGPGKTVPSPQWYGMVWSLGVGRGRSITGGILDMFLSQSHEIHLSVCVCGLKYRHCPGRKI